MNSQKAKKRLLVPNRPDVQDLKNLDKMQDLQKKLTRKEEERRDLKLLVPNRLDVQDLKNLDKMQDLQKKLTRREEERRDLKLLVPNHPDVQNLKNLDKMHEDLQNELTRKEDECRDLNKIIKKLEILSTKKDEEIERLKIHVQDLECDNLERESQFAVFEEVISEWQTHSANLEDSQVEWKFHAETLQTKVDEATSRFVGCEAGFSKIILSVLSTMLTNGMSIGVGSIYREAERFLKAFKVLDEDGFTKGYHEDLERGVTHEEVQKAKRRRIARSSDENRFFEVPLEENKEGAHEKHWQEEERGHHEDHVLEAM
jgi:hypothetical protein